MIVVTGSEGYIGKALCDKLDESASGVLRVDYQKGGGVQELSSLPRTTTCVFHLAALASAGESEQRTAAYHEENFVATRHLLKLCKQLQTPPRVVFASTCAVYGDCYDREFTEQSATYPISYYGATKLACENLLLSNRSFVDVYALRIFNVVGKGGGHPSRLLPTLLRSAANGAVTTIYGPNTLRDYVHVDDVVDALLRASTRSTPYRIFNIGTGKGTTPLALARLVADEAKTPPLLSLADRRPYDPPHAVCDNSLARVELGWSPVTNLRKVVAEEWNSQRAT